MPAARLRVPAPRRCAILQRRTKAQRQAERTRIGPLKSTLVKPKTLARYQINFERFVRWMRQNSISFPKAPEAADARLERYIEALWECGDPLGHANDAVSGFIFFVPICKGCLPRAKRLLTAWARSEQPNRAPPFLAVTAYAVALYFLRQGWRDSALFFVLGWETWARPGELFASRKRDFNFCSNGSFSVATWSLPLSKSGQRQGTVETLVIEDPFAVAALQRYVGNLYPGEMLSKVSGQVHRNRLASALTALGLPSSFRWYSLRRGGATSALRGGKDLGLIRQKGRWLSEKAATIYLNEGLALLSLRGLQPKKIQRLVALATRLRPGWRTCFRALAR